MRRKVEVPLWVWEFFWGLNFLAAAGSGSWFGVILAGLLMVLPLRYA